MTSAHPGRRRTTTGDRITSWEDRVVALWQDAESLGDTAFRDAFLALLDERPADDPLALYERASMHDSLGEEAEAVPLYRAAIPGLDPDRRARATIQLASSLRVLGDPSGAIALLSTFDATSPLAGAAQAFLALALHDDQKPSAALRTALTALAPHLPAYARSVTAYAHDLHGAPRIRNVAVGLVVRDGHVLAEEYRGRSLGHPFLRLPGGGVEFGETADQAVRRELREELGAEATDVEPLAVVENIFASATKTGHEIMHVFAVRAEVFDDLPLDARLRVLDSDTTVGWYSLATLAAGAPPLYPARALALAEDLVRRPL